MPNPTCPNCQRQMVVANPQFCPFCSYQFGMPLQPVVPVVDLVAHPYAEIPPIRPTQAPPPIPMLDRPSPATALVPNSLKTPRFTTTWGRSIGITLGLLILALVVVFFLVQNVIHPNQSADQWFSTVLTDVDWGATLNPPPIYHDFYQPFISILITLAPMAVVIGYWFSLRRLFQEWAVWVWLKTWGLTTLFLLVGMVACGAMIGHGGQGMSFLTAYPKTIVLLVLVAALCSGIGIAFGFFFALWPIERMRTLNSNVWADLSLTFFSGFLGLAVQYIFYHVLTHSEEAFVSALWWLPVAAIGIAAYACWAALRPLHLPLPGSNQQ